MHSLKSIYFSYIHSHIAYGISLYGATSVKNLTKILCLQKRALRIMLGLRSRDTVKLHFKNLGIMTVFAMYVLQTVMFVKEHTIKSTGCHKHVYNTRGKSLVETRRHNLELSKKKASVAGLKFLRMLPSKITSLEPNKKFKKELKSYLVQIAPYSIDEVFFKD